MTRTYDCDHVISAGTLRSNSARVDYYTTTPAPDQWVAVGVMVDDNSPNTYFSRRKLIVGNGSREADAVTDLKQSFAKAVSAQAIAKGVSTQPELSETSINLPPSIVNQEQPEVDDTASIRQ